MLKIINELLFMLISVIFIQCTHDGIIRREI